MDDGQANVTYDDTAYNVVVTVADQGTGQLQAQVTYGNDAAPVFQNKATPEPPKDDGKTDEQPPSKGAAQDQDQEGAAGQDRRLITHDWGRGELGGRHGAIGGAWLCT